MTIPTREEVERLAEDLAHAANFGGIDVDIDLMNQAGSALRSLSARVEEARWQPLNAAMDNVHASRLGEALRDAAAVPYGDNIDRGLSLVRLLAERGYSVSPLPSPPKGDAP